MRAVPPVDPDTRATPVAPDVSPLSPLLLKLYEKRKLGGAGTEPEPVLETPVEPEEVNLPNEQPDFTRRNERRRPAPLEVKSPSLIKAAA
jgi:hypothetical protein